MRPIEFRAKAIEDTDNADNGEWVHGYIVEDQTGDLFDRIGGMGIIGTTYAGNNLYAGVDPETVGQYTSAKDKNGVKIFEGDILQTNSVDGTFSGIGVPLSDGRVLLFSDASSTVAVFDPADNALAVVQGAASGGFLSGALLRDGRVFLTPTGTSAGYSYFTVNYMPKFEGGSLSLDRDLGACADSFVHPDIPAYALEDTGAPVEATTVGERLAGVLLREFTAEEGAAVTPAKMPPALYRELPNGQHKYEIAAANPRGVARITHSFEKRVAAAEVRTKPLRANGRPKRAWLYVLGSFPEGCRLSVWICNNGNDEEPAWQDVTDRASVNLTEEDKTITFANEEKTADGWGVRVRLERGDAEGECYISHIGGNFQ